MNYPGRPRRLHAVPDDAPQQPANAEALHLFATLADLTADGGPWVVDDCDRNPIMAAVVVTFDANGEPTPFTAGMSQVTQDDQAWAETLRQALRSLDALQALGTPAAAIKARHQPPPNRPTQL